MSKKRNEAIQEIIKEHSDNYYSVDKCGKVWSHIIPPQSDTEKWSSHNVYQLNIGCVEPFFNHDWKFHLYNEHHESIYIIDGRPRKIQL